VQAGQAQAGQAQAVKERTVIAARWIIETKTGRLKKTFAPAPRLARFRAQCSKHLIDLAVLGRNRLLLRVGNAGRWPATEIPVDLHQFDWAYKG